MEPGASLNVGLTIISRGEFSIILANLAKAGGLLAVLQPFAALYVLILAVLGPLLTKGSERIGALSAAALGRASALLRRRTPPARRAPAELRERRDGAEPRV